MKEKDAKTQGVSAVSKPESSKPVKDSKKGVRQDLEDADDEESYYKWMEENPNAGRGKIGCSDFTPNDTSLNDVRSNNTNLNDTNLINTSSNNTSPNNMSLNKTSLNNTSLNDMSLNDTILNDTILKDTS